MNYAYKLDKLNSLIECAKFKNGAELGFRLAKAKYEIIIWKRDALIALMGLVIVILALLVAR